MLKKQKDVTTVELVGGHECLDFVNTAGRRGSENSVEWLNTYQDLVLWCRRSHIITSQELKQLNLKAAQRIVEAEKALVAAIGLRETLYRILASTLAKAEASRSDLVQFNVMLARTMMQSRILPDPTGFQWNSKGNTDKLDWVLNPLVRSAADLLTSRRLMRVRSCADTVCGRLFLDMSRNKSRRWCDMKSCGNRAKAMRFYQKKKRTLQTEGQD